MQEDFEQMRKTRESFTSDKYDKQIFEFLKLEYDLWGKITLFSAGLIGIPATLLKLNALNVNLHLLVFSWSLFLANIIIGFLSLHFFYRSNIRIVGLRSTLELNKTVFKVLKQPGGARLSRGENKELMITKEMKPWAIPAVEENIEKLVKKLSSPGITSMSGRLVLFLEAIFFLSFTAGVVILALSVVLPLLKG